ncbi:hypothetical protein Arad_2087 [Rhizobium rhizogenes K84]|uniref:Uncharacterized protein n=1 Tax=Rhizobium rhizogenes (strain K84 / ATCC BAA-868) TaxID=311403 RepID=B9JEE3_RHIR8|nr:hypothetical protein Arad_2087 [Rhizobium rhizogenes K84]
MIDISAFVASSLHVPALSIVCEAPQMEAPASGRFHFAGKLVASSPADVRLIQLFA